MKAIELVLVCAITFILLAAEHFFFTWRLAAGRRIKPPWTYIIGVASLFAPYAVLMALWGHNEATGALLAIVVSGGLAVGGGYHLLTDKLLRDENRQLRAHLGESVGGGGNGHREKDSGSRYL